MSGRDSPSGSSRSPSLPASSLRGRGRGRGRPSTPSSLSRSIDVDDAESQSQQDTSNYDDSTTMDVDYNANNAAAGPSTSRLAGFSSSMSGSTAAGASGGPSRGTLLGRGSSYTSGTKMKFRPNMVVRKAKTEDAVKEEEIEPSLHDSSARGRGRGGRGRGDDRGRGSARGRGRGRGEEIVMTASGAFALGPHQQAREKASRGQAFGPSVMSGRAGGSGGGGGGSGADYSKPSSTAQLIDSDPEDNDDTAYGGSGKVPTVDLYDIGLEGEMAPLVLPRDEKKWREEEGVRKENEIALKRMTIDESKKKGQKMDIDEVKKLDPYEEEERMQASLHGTPAPGSASVSSTPAPAAQGHEHDAQAAADDANLTVEQEAVTLGLEDVQIITKKEDISYYFQTTPGSGGVLEGSNKEAFYLFQFPRMFPRFWDPNDEEQTKEGSNTAVKTEDGEGAVKVEADVKPSTSASSNAAPGLKTAGKPKEKLLENPYSTLSKHRVVSSLHESESEVWRDYEPGKWQGWGKNSGSMNREDMAGNKKAEGMIGKMRIRKSGKVSLRLGSRGKEGGIVDYEILPGAPASFLQEIAVLQAANNLSEETLEETARGLYLMGQLSKKFLIAPDLSKLLSIDAKEKREQYAAWKKQQDELQAQAKKAKAEEKETKLEDTKKKAPAKKVAVGAAVKPKAGMTAAPKKTAVTGAGRGRGKVPATASATATAKSGL